MPQGLRSTNAVGLFTDIALGRVPLEDDPTVLGHHMNSLLSS